MASRISSRFTALSKAGRSGLVTFITAGDPSPAATVPFMHALVRGGADIIELGVPFSDPMADGPIIQRASERALTAGMSLKHVLEAAQAFRATNRETPVVLMGYLNPIERMGYATFAARAAAAGIDGILTVDLPPEEGADFQCLLREHGLDQIHLLAPTSSAQRIEAVCSHASGFVYYVSVKGVTGDKAFDPDEVRTRIAGLRQKTALPVGVGFGVKTSAAAATIAAVSDAVIVGSVLVEIIEEADSIDAAAAQLEQFVRGLRTAMDAGRAAA
ncbi:MAG: tryptophan synthase subunit alpha [Gammaproteobacteria bacterium]|nr:tryptophan synthase subunit alpha [Gammaproteobacteria bacterium]